MKKILFLLLIPLFSFSQDKVGFLDSTLVSDGISLEQIRYINQVKVRSIYDGDTPTLDVELGFSTIRIERFRLYGIQAPEIRLLSTRLKGEASRKYLQDLTNQCDYLFVQTFPDKFTYEDDKGKYGRYLGVLYGVCGDLIISLNDRMVEAGQAIYKSY